MTERLQASLTALGLEEIPASMPALDRALSDALEQHPNAPDQRRELEAAHLDVAAAFWSRLDQEHATRAADAGTAQRRTEAEHEGAVAAKAARAAERRRELQLQHERDIAQGWPRQWRPGQVSRWQRLGGTVDQARKVNDGGWPVAGVFDAAASLGSVGALTFPNEPWGVQKQFGDTAEQVLTGKVPPMPGDTCAVVKRHTANDRAQRWYLTRTSDATIQVTLLGRSVAGKWRSRQVGTFADVLAAFGSVSALRKAPPDAATVIIAPDQDAGELLALIPVPPADPGGVSAWPAEVEQDWQAEDDWLRTELPTELAALVRLRVNGIRAIPWRGSRPRQWIRLGPESEEWWESFEAVAQYTWFSESGGAPISWDGGNSLSIAAPGVLMDRQWGDEGTDWAFRSWPSGRSGQAAAIADWLTVRDLETVAALQLEPCPAPAEFAEWADVPITLGLYVDEDTLQALRRRLGRTSAEYRAARQALRHPKGPLGQALKAALREAAESQFTGQLYNHWSDIDEK